MDNKILDIKNLSITYEADGAIVKAVNDISFSLKKGDALGLVGETGAGKTTTALAIMQLLPSINSKVTDGEIKYEGTNVITMPEEKKREYRGNKISMIFQDPMTALNPIFTVGEQIAEVIRLHNTVTEKEASKRAEDMLEMVGIPRNRYYDYPHQFSGGMKQRVIIAIALACTPSLLIADEPTTALDVTIQAQVLALIERLRKENNTSLILITHDLGVIAETCERAAIMYAGEIVEIGTTEQIFNNTKHPYTEGLFGSIPNINKKVNRLTPIPGLAPDPTDLPKGCKFAPRCKYKCEECEKGNIPVFEVEEGHFVKCLRCRDNEEVQ